LPIRIAPAARGLADQDRPGGARAPDRLGVPPGHVVGEHRRPVGRTDALGVEQILDGEGDAFERAGRPAPPGRLGRAGLGAGAVEAERGEPADGGVDGFDPGGERIDDLGRGNTARLVLAQQLLDACGVQLAHRGPHGTEREPPEHRTDPTSG
jgi:hypothetical protein